MSAEYPKTKVELLANIESEWSALMDVSAKLNASQMSMPDSGGWSPKDNLAHIAEWLKILLGYFMDQRPSHEVIGVAPEVTENWDFNVINQILLERDRNRSMEDVLEELQREYARLMDKLQSMPFDELLKPSHADDPQSSPLLSSVVGDTYEHFAEHRETIEKFRQTMNY